MTAGSHPARSPEFLSRLHDGELSPAERAHFESHRAHCAECRRAAAEFEAALAFYRSSRPNPPSPDLAARILRKLQSSGNRRPFFGATFGIDLRWAGAFAAAVIATIVGSAIVAKNEATERMAREEPIRVSVERERKPATSELALPAAPPPPPAAQSGGIATRSAEGRPTASARPAEVRRRQTRREGNLAEAAPEMAKKDEVGAADSLREKRKSAEPDAAGSPTSRLVLKNAAPPAAPAAPAASAAEAPSVDVVAPKAASRSAGRAEAPTGTGQLADAPPRPVRLVIREADGAGSPPELLHPRDAEIPATLRGRTFLLVVDAAGRVREAVPSETGPREDAAADARKEEAPALFSLRFAPGDRQRRLWLRIE